MEFEDFARIIEAKFESLMDTELFITVPGQTIADAYMEAFPDGTNPIYKVRPVHDCDTCRRFVKNLGNVVQLLPNGKRDTVWNVTGLEYPYDVVAATLHKLVSKAEVSELFRVNEKKYGSHFTVQELPEGGTKRWNHFCGRVSSRFMSSTVDADRGAAKSKVQTLRRAVTELTVDALKTVIDLIKPADPELSEPLYRGEEFLSAVKEFLALKHQFDALDESQHERWLWNNYTSYLSGFRNTMMGKLVTALSDEEPLEEAVGKYESQAAPSNYKRSKALVTPGMVKQAMKIIEELDLEDSLKRRLANVTDVSTNNVLWVNRSTRSKMKDGSLSELLLDSLSTNADTQQKATEISLEFFLSQVLSKATALEVLVKNAQISNFVTLTAPEYSDAKPIFKWNNGFAWSYSGNVTDSIKERVKRAGGNVTNAALRVSLAWHNGDDLDLHVVEPNGNHIYYHAKDGKLDVDMNGIDRHDDVAPVENVSWTGQNLRDGEYKVYVNMYNKRSTSNKGFEMEVECGGQIQSFKHEKDLRETSYHGRHANHMHIKIKNGQIVDLKTHQDLVGGSASKTVWGIETEKFVPVNMVMNSPNYWDDNETGNRHLFLIMDKCHNPEPARGIYNEFLMGSLTAHRKTFELLGEKTKCPVVDDQLSGVGFSSTRQDQVLVRATSDKMRKVFNIVF